MENPGMSPAVQEALQRRGMTGGTGALNQTSPEAPMSNPTPQPTAPSSLNQASAPQMSAPTQKFQPQNQDDIIVSALIEQLKNNQKLKKEESQMSAPQIS